MDRDGMVLAGLVVSAIGILTIFTEWYSVFFDTTVLSGYWSYNGIDVLTSGDFTEPGGLFYDSLSPGGVYIPSIIAFLFLAMLIRFACHLNLSYLDFIVILSIFVILGSIFSMSWIYTETVHEVYGSYGSSFGIGPVLSIILAIIASAIARSIDNYSPNPESVGAPRKKKFCPKCGKELTMFNDPHFCRFCGADLTIRNMPKSNSETSATLSDNNYALFIQAPPQIIYSDCRFDRLEVKIDGDVYPIELKKSVSAMVSSGEHTVRFTQYNCNEETFEHEQSITVNKNTHIDIIISEGTFIFLTN